MKSRRTLLNAIGTVVILGLFLAGCGGGKSPSLRIEMTDFSFTPSEMSVPTGQTITLSATNKGANEHEFVIMNLGQEVSVPFGDDDEGKIYWEVEVGSGESKGVTFTAPSQPGKYQIVCGIPGHIEHGMLGTLTVQ